MFRYYSYIVHHILSNSQNKPTSNSWKCGSKSVIQYTICKSCNSCEPESQTIMVDTVLWNQSSNQSISDFLE